MFVAFGTQHEICKSYILFACVTCPAVPYFSILSHEKHHFWKNVLAREMCVLILSTTLSETYLTLSTTDLDIIINIHVVM